MKKRIYFIFFFLCIIGLLQAQQKHVFKLGSKDFLLDGKPFMIIAGEMHPARIPREYWRHRIQMARAMGCNTISAYLFWNYYETSQGQFDFKSGNRDIAEFIRIIKEEGMWILLRPGPYACAEWDFGGLPPYLLNIPDIRIRCMDSRYMDAVGRYINALAPLVKNELCTQGGPILMIQIENEYGSYGNDKEYMETLKKIWLAKGIDVPFFTCDGPTPYMLEAGSLEGCAIGLNSGSSPEDFRQAFKENPNVPAFSSETYPGWLTHWGEKWAKVETKNLLKELQFLLDSSKSFNLYMVHGGTNFGFSAGANSGGKGYEPDVTSYDYDAPITEQGLPTEKYYALRELFAKYTGPLPPVPGPVPTIEIPEIKMEIFTSVWKHLANPQQVVQPRPMEAFGQYQGFILYHTKLIGHKSGKLDFNELHDYGLIFMNNKYIGKIDRREGENSIILPVSGVETPELDVFIEAMGHINFAQHMIDRKGITDRITLNEMTLMNWDVYNLPFDEKFIADLKQTVVDTSRKLIFFRGNFNLNITGDTWFDMSNYRKGLVFINGHNLGRYWDIGPQKRLYCPASWLRQGRNEIIVFDLHQTEAKPIGGFNKSE